MPSTMLTVQRVSRLANIPTDRQLKKWALAAIATIHLPAEITLRIVNSAEARNLNSAFRGKDYATNVLTFVYHERTAPMMMGDLVLCAQVIAFEAKKQQKQISDHYAHLTIHGILHIAGFDHEKLREASRMEVREIEILAELGISNPYENIGDDGEARTPGAVK